MNSALDLIISLLKNQRETYEELLRLSVRKQEAVTRGDVGELDVIVQAEELLLMKICESEHERLKIVSDFCSNNGISESEFKFSEWPGVNSKQKKLIEEVKTEFLETLDKLTKANIANQKLISLQLEYIHHIIEETGGIQKQNAYDSDGSIASRDTDTSRIMDIRT